MQTINERIFDIIKSNKDFSQKKMALATGISTGTINSWLKRGSAMPADVIIPICNYLSVSPEYLLTGEQKEIDGLRPDERKLLQAYNQLDNSRQAMLHAYSDGLLAAKEIEKNG